MRSIIGTLATVTAAATTLGLATVALAVDDAATLRCDAAIAKGESRLFGCLAQCRDRADKRGATFSADDEARCTNRCARPFERVARGPRCAGAAIERVWIERFADADATSLRCRATASALASRLSSCLADCAELAEHAASHHIPNDANVCVEACGAIDAAAVALAAARTGCDLGTIE